MKVPHKLLAFLLLCSFVSCKLANKNEKPSTYVPLKGHPDWIRQSNIYEVNVRQYTPEGTFKAFEAALPRLKDMGVDILWFMPINPISKVDRKGTLGSYYAVSDYKGINPEYGNLDDFKWLVKKCHDFGFKVIIDWVANHTGGDNRWLTAHPDFYNHDSTGKVKYAYDWTDTRDLNYDNREMRDSMVDAMSYWIDAADIDGFRCDAASEVPTDFWKSCIAELKKEKDVFMLAEGDKADLHEAGFDATYPWDMFQTMKKVAAGERNALSLDTVLMRQDSTFPAGAIRMYFTSNHDENSWNKSDFGTFPGPKHAPFAVFTQTMRASLPLIYSGQEEPILKAISFFEKDTMHFANYERAAFYKTLLDLRNKNAALAVDADFKKDTVGDNKALYAYTRQKGRNKVLVILNFSDQEQTYSVKDASLAGNPRNLFTGEREKVDATEKKLSPWGYLVYVY